MNTSFILILIAVAILFLVIGMAWGKSRARNSGQMFTSQIVRLPAQFASPAAPPAPAAAGMESVVALIRSGNKIAAIRDYREMTGCGLKEAKDAVEAIERNL